MAEMGDRQFRSSDQVCGMSFTLIPHEHNISLLMVDINSANVERL